MKKVRRIYLDTSVIGGCCDDEFAWWSKRLIHEFASGRLIPVISSLTIAEIINAPTAVQNILEGILKTEYILAEETEESLLLAQFYIDSGILTTKFRDDARHIAIATINNVDLLVSWNFKHIVHYEKIEQFNSVNIRNGYRGIRIYSPREVVSYEDI
jgi:hypothetical protein